MDGKLRLRLLGSAGELGHQIVEPAVIGTDAGLAGVLPWTASRFG